ncbi:MAG: hypothetical protein FLDDKLPJ_02283 [Phycisphaerae bacterium]|nr:hypothetical protein [Phycisphaerae bacterium]
MRTLKIQAQRATPALLAELESRGLIRPLTPPPQAMTVALERQVVERVELAREESGPWQMLVVACNRSRLTCLAAHNDIESWLFFADPASKPLLYVVAACAADEFTKRAENGALTESDFLAVEFAPNDPQTSFFTVPAGVLHDELTYAGPGRAPVFFVPEPSRMTHTKVDLAAYDIRVTPPC